MSRTARKGAITIEENEAISELEKFQIQVEHSIAEEECCEYDNSEKELQKDEKFLYAFDMAITALEEIQQYREIGTVEECREAIEKQKPKRPYYEGDGYADGYMVYDTWICPNCGEKYEVDYDNYKYCPKCGQSISWEESEEE